jgi:pimeloyl-ACP methyl ester carboxylesterase
MTENKINSVPEIKYQEYGQGKTIVFLHGFLESSAIWEDFAQELSAKFRIFTIDLPGHGGSGVLAEEHSMELMAEEVKNILEIEGIQKIMLVGHSMGGYVSLAFAEKYPQMVKGLIMFHSQAAADNDETKKNRDRTIGIIENDKTSFIKNFIPELFAPDNRKLLNKEINVLIDSAVKTPKEGIIAAIKGMRNRKDRTHVIKAPGFPVLFLAGKHDTRAPLDQILEQVDHSEKAMVMIFEDCGHMGYLESRDQTLEVIYDFATSVL